MAVLKTGADDGDSGTDGYDNDGYDGDGYGGDDYGDDDDDY
jgi:hypothetical protein